MGLDGRVALRLTPRPLLGQCPPMVKRDEVQVRDFGHIELRGLRLDVPIGRPGAQVPVAVDLSVFRPVLAAADSDKPVDTLQVEELCAAARRLCSEQSFQTLEAFAAAFARSIFEIDNAARKIRITALEQNPEASLPLAAAGLTLELQKGDGRPPWSGDRKPERSGGRGGRSDSGRGGRPDQGGRGPRGSRDDRGRDRR